MTAITTGADNATGYAQTSSLTVVKRRLLDLLKATREGIARAGTRAYQRISTLFGGMPKGFWFLAGATTLVHRPARDAVSGFVGRVVRGAFGLVGRVLRFIGRGLTWIGVTVGEKIRGENESGIRYAIGNRIVLASQWGYRNTTAGYNQVVRGLRWVDFSIATAWDHRFSRNTGIALGALVLAVLVDTFFFGMTGLTGMALANISSNMFFSRLLLNGVVVAGSVNVGRTALALVGITLGAGYLGQITDRYRVEVKTKAAPAATATTTAPGPVTVQGSVVPMRGSSEQVAASLSSDELEQMAANNAADERELGLATTGQGGRQGTPKAPGKGPRGGRSGRPGN